MSVGQCTLCSHRASDLARDERSRVAVCGVCRRHLGRWLATSASSVVEQFWSVKAGPAQLPLEERPKPTPEQRRARVAEAVPVLRDLTQDETAHSAVEEIFAEFQAGLRLVDLDALTCADLAVAYSEMGLHGDALQTAGDALALGAEGKTAAQALRIIFSPKSFRASSLQRLAETLFLH